MNYGKAIKIVRAAKGISQRELANLVNLDPSYISLLESNQRTPALKTLEKLSKKLAIPLPLLTFLASDKNQLKAVDTNLVEEVSRELLEVLIDSQANFGNENS